MSDLDDIVAALVAIEHRLRELSLDRLRRAVADEDADAEAEERRIQKARRAVTKAIRDLGGEPEEVWT